MRHLLQNLSNGNTYLAESEIPLPSERELLIQNFYSLVSPGTEKMLTEFGNKSWIAKIRDHPDRFAKIMEKVRSEGLVSTYHKVRTKLEQPIPLGYSSAGVVISVGSKVRNFKIGDRVISNGAHAEFVSVNENLVCAIPAGLDFKTASFGVLASVGLHGVRLMAPAISEKIVVIGLGLIGMITAQILMNSACEVIALDIDERKVERARNLHINAIHVNNEQQTLNEILTWTSQMGADGILITASSRSDDIIHQAAQMCRKRGKIVLIGSVGLHLKRDDFYKKEISFQVSCSYGPGRYDDHYEKESLDYPYAYVRWTENRNFESILSLMASEKIRVDSLIDGVFPIEEFESVYQKINSSDGLAYLFEYAHPVQTSKSILQRSDHAVQNFSKNGLGLIGSGSYLSSILLPIIKKSSAQIEAISSRNSSQVTHLVSKFNISRQLADPEALISDPAVGSVIIANKHQDHAALVVKGLQADKHIFVEKPLALDLDALEEIKSSWLKSKGSLLVGFNRRFSGICREIKKQLSNSRSPVQIVGTMNAGHLPPDHWIQDPEVGGGRILGEACHYFDLFVYLTGSLISEVYMNSMQPFDKFKDHASINLNFVNGSAATIHYFSNGSVQYPKERIEIYQAGKTCVIHNFKSIQNFGFNALNSSRTIDKGQTEMLRTWFHFTENGGEDPITFEEMYNVTKAVLFSLESYKTNLPQKVM